MVPAKQQNIAKIIKILPSPYFKREPIVFYEAVILISSSSLICFNWFRDNKVGYMA